MTISRSEIERTLDELVSYEEGTRFQRLGVVLAKQRWPSLVASERKRDLGLDAYGPAIDAADGIGRGLICSITATLTKAKTDAQRISENFSDIQVLIFYTPKVVSRQKAQSWTDEIKKSFGYQLVVVSREDIVTSLIEPSGRAICSTFLGIAAPIDRDVEALHARALAATRETIANWMAHARIIGRPLMSLNMSEIDANVEQGEQAFDLARLNQSLSEGRRIILEASAGSGKTTTLIQLAETQKRSGRLGFMIDLPGWIRSRRSILDFVAGTRAAQSQGLTAADLARLWSSKPCSFLLNGWNEISEANSDDAVQMFRDLDRDFPDAGIIVATRTHYIRPPLPGALRVKLLPLNRRQRRDHLGALLGAKAGRLVSQLEANANLDALTRTPFILSAVATVFQSGRSIPATKIELLRSVMQLMEAAEEHRSHLQQPPLAGRAMHYLMEFAYQMTANGVVAVSDEHARTIVAAASRALRDAEQIAALPEPASVLNALCQHHVLERIEDSSISFRFQHQQFQEFLAGTWLEAELRALNDAGDRERRRVFQAEYVDKPMWGEPLRMIAEAISGRTAESDDEIEAGKLLVELSLPVDPIFAGELSRLCGPLIWSRVRSAVGERLRRWYQVANYFHRRSALAGMLATGSEDFIDIILPLLTSEDPQRRLETYRALGEFHVLSLGQDWREVVRGWTEDRRIEFIHEVTWQGSMDAAPIAEDFASNDLSQKVRAQAILAFEWMGADYAMERLVAGIDDEAFLEVLGHGAFIESLPDSLRPRAIAAYRGRLESLTDTNDRIRSLIRIGELGDPDAVEQLTPELSRMTPGRIDPNTEPLFRSAVTAIRAANPDWANRWVSERIAAGTIWHEYWTDLITSVPDDLASRLLERLSTEDLQYRDISGIVTVLSKLGSSFPVRTVFARLVELKEETLGSGHPLASASWQIRRQLTSLMLALPATTVVAGVLGCLSSEFKLEELLVVTELFGDMSNDTIDVRGNVPDELRQRLRIYLRQGVPMLLKQDDFAGEIKMHLALALGRVGDPEDMSELRLLIQRDIDRVRSGREARARGEHSAKANGAVMSCANWNLRAVELLDSRDSDNLLIDLLQEPEYEGDAGWALVRLACKDVAAVRPPFGAIDYKAVWNARAGRGNSRFDEARRTAYANAIRTSVLALLEQQKISDQPDTYNHRLKGLAKMLAVIDGRASATLVLDVLALPAKWDAWTRIQGLHALLQSGVALPTDGALAVLNPVIEEVLGRGVFTDQDITSVRDCMCLMPFLANPSDGMQRIKETLSRTRFPAYALRELVTALGHSRHGAALDLLVELSQTDQRSFQTISREWIAAVGELDLPASRQLLLGFVDPSVPPPRVEAPVSYPGSEHLASQIAIAARKDASIKARIVQLCDSDLPANKRALLAAVIAKMVTPDAVEAGIGLIRDSENPVVPVDLRRAVEGVFVERRPYGTSQSTFSLEPRDFNRLRAKLLDLALSDQRRRQGAFALLGEIEVWRLDYGKPNSEPRHPNLTSGVEWPLLETMR